MELDAVSRRVLSIALMFVKAVHLYLLAYLNVHLTLLYLDCNKILGYKKMYMILCYLPGWLLKRLRYYTGG